MRPRLQETIGRLIETFPLIPPSRKDALAGLAAFVNGKSNAGKMALLNFICTHNSRRSQVAQLWAQAAAAYYRIPNVSCFSGGTEATEFNTRAVAALQRAGFDIHPVKEQRNPVYHAVYDDQSGPIVSFSKRYDDASNPREDFAAVMTCSEADEGCPVVAGAAARIALPYDDPKRADGGPREAETYNERVLEIGRDMLYAFSIL